MSILELQKRIEALASKADKDQFEEYDNFSGNVLRDITNNVYGFKMAEELPLNKVALSIIGAKKLVGKAFAAINNYHDCFEVTMELIKAIVEFSRCDSKKDLMKKEKEFEFFFDEIGFRNLREFNSDDSSQNPPFFVYHGFGTLFDVWSCYPFSVVAPHPFESGCEFLQLGGHRKLMEKFVEIFSCCAENYFFGIRYHKTVFPNGTTIWIPWGDPCGYH